jgi:hypothetical protein
MNPQSVFLVTDRVFGDRLLEIADLAPVWIVDSPANHPAISNRWGSAAAADHRFGVTSFRDHPEHSAADVAAEMIATIAEHHPGFSQLTILGSDDSPALSKELANIGFVLKDRAGSKLMYERGQSTPNQLPEPTLASGTSPAAQEPRHR